jgi:hypothetical protein
MENIRELFLNLNHRERKRQFRTPSELASEFDLSTSRIRQLVDEGKIFAIRVSGRIYVHKSSAEKIMVTDY